MTTAPYSDKDQALTPLLTAMQLTDSAVPTGAFSHSLGFETYLEAGQIASEVDFSTWVEMFTAQQLTFTDALAIRLVFQAGEFDEVADIDQRVTALALPQQVRQAGITMGRRLLSIGVQSYPGVWLSSYHEGVESGRLNGHQACVWAVLARSVGIGEDVAVAQHLYATIISLTQNAVRAIPLGQNAGQRIIATARESVLGAVGKSRQLSHEDLGAIAPGLEIAQMKHERQRARLFMS